MTRALFGMETEYGCVLLDGCGRAADWGRAGQALLEFFGQRLPSVPGRGKGRFLSNGGLFYLDGGHAEYCTPECTTPTELVAALAAGDRLVAEAATALERGQRLAKARFFLGNVDHGCPMVSWGCHESYRARTPPQTMLRLLGGHLASRIVYAGSGGFDSVARGLEFSLSPRARHLVRPVHDARRKGLLCGKSTSDDDGSYRLHLTCGDALCSQLGNYLKVGPTALVVALIDAGDLRGDELVLSSPLDALQGFAADPTLRASVVLERERQPITALGLQRRYLERAEAAVGRKGFPRWAGAVCRRWRAVLDALEDGGAALGAKLDWPLRHAVFTRALRSGYAAGWSEVEELNAVARRSAVRQAPVERLDSLTRGREPGPQQRSRQLGELLTHGGLAASAAQRFVAMRNDMLALDMRFGELGNDGIFASLDAAGLLDHQVIAGARVSRAMSHPPKTTRARVRGEAIAQLGDQQPDAQGRWETLVCGERVLDLTNPFARHGKWVTRGRTTVIL